MAKVSVDITQIREAAQRVDGAVHRTPVLTSRGFDEQAGVRAFFKCENFQRGGSFKIRGASNFLLSIPPADLARGVVTFSSGNHAIAVAMAARRVGTHATLVMPRDAPRSKLAASRAQGATIVPYDRATEDYAVKAAGIAAETGATLVPPFDHPWIQAGQGTAGLEFAEQAPPLDALVVPVGGGGLIAGCTVAAKAANPAIRVFGAEPELARDWWLSFEAGRRVEIPMPATIADGLRTTCPGVLEFEILSRLAEGIVLVSEEEIVSTVRYLLTRLKILVEPSGAVAAAAVLYRKLPPGLGSVGVVLSGGNMDFERLAALTAPAPA